MAVRHDFQQCDTDSQLSTKRSLVINLQPDIVGVVDGRLSNVCVGWFGMIGYRQ